jgi:predicted amidophosphoribosyltransferase
MNNHKRLCRELYHGYKEHGICARCGGQWAEPGYVFCKTCIDKNRKSQEKHDPTGDKKRERMRILRENRRAAGLCFSCGGKLNGIHKQCDKCRNKQRESQQIQRIKKRLQK